MFDYYDPWLQRLHNAEVERQIRQRNRFYHTQVARYQRPASGSIRNLLALLIAHLR